jgi:hypothetical protein
MPSKPCLFFDKSLDIIGTEAEALSRQFHLLQLTAPSHGVNGLNFETEHHGDLFRFEQPSSLLVFIHACYYMRAFVILSREVSESGGDNGAVPTMQWIFAI